MRLPLAFIGALVLAAALASCAGKSPSSDRLVQEFADAVNAGSAGDYISAGFDNDRNMLVISMRVDDTPDNAAKLVLLGNDTKAQQIFRTTILEYLEEGDVLARIIKEGRPVAYTVNCGEMEYAAIFTPDELKNSVFGKK